MDGFKENNFFTLYSQITELRKFGLFKLMICVIMLLS